MTAILITGASRQGGEVGDIAIAGGVFVSAEDVSGTTGLRVIDATGLVALPGFVDLHTHLRQPGMERAETVLTGSRAAALGGYTAVFAMANTTPVSDSVEAVTAVSDWGLTAGYVDVRPIGAVTVGQRGVSLAPIAEMASSKAQVTIFSDDGHCVFDDELMREALDESARLGVVIAQHAQDPHKTVGAVMNEGALAARLGLTGWPASAEESVISRDLSLVKETGGHLHVCHVSTAESVEVLRWARAKGIPYSAEVTPHHLLLTEELVTSYDPVFKVNPPLRRKEDTLALRAALAEGIIDIVATDHAPHPAESKECSFAEGAFGMLGLESAFGVVNTVMVQSGLLDWAAIARVLSTRPAEIGRLAGYDKPWESGSPAHLTLVDPTSPTPSPKASLSGNTPYHGIPLTGAVVHTFYRGEHTVANGNIVERNKG